MMKSLLFILIIIATISNAIPFHDVNDIDVDGNTCPSLTLDNVQCPPVLCVSDASLCPDSIKPTCSNSTLTFCGDGSCKESCGDIQDVCNCNSKASDSTLTSSLTTTSSSSSSSGDLFQPCARVDLKVNLTNYIPVKVDEITNEQCSKVLLLLFNSSLNNPDSTNNLKSTFWSPDTCTPPEPILTFTEPILVHIYTTLSIQILILVLWYFYKNFMENKSINYTINHSSTTTTSATSATTTKPNINKTINNDNDNDDDGNSTTIVQPYKTNLLGTLAKLSVLITSLSLVTWLLLLVLDNYGKVIPLPLGAGYGLFHGQVDFNYKTFCTLWHISAFWFVFININWEKSKTFFKLKCNGIQATCVRIDKLKERIIMLDDSSWLVKKVNSIEKAFNKYIVGSEFNVFNSNVKTAISKGTSTSNQVLRYFEFECTRYVLDENTGLFAPVVVDMPKKIGNLGNGFNDGLTKSKATDLLDKLGPNFIPVKVPPFIVAMGQEFRSYFYLYQMLCIFVYCSFSYYYIGMIQGCVILISAFVKVIVRLTSENKIKSLAEYHDDCQVLRDGKWTNTSSTDLVPGDIIQIVPNVQVPCDAVLLTGDVVCDESGLTGEPLPVRKFPLPSHPSEAENLYDPHGSSKKSTLFSGTTVLQAASTGTSTQNNLDATQQFNGKAVGLVMSTGRSTDKGALIRDILFPTPISFVFDIHLRIVIVILLIWGTWWFGWSIFLLGVTNISSWYYGIFIISEVMTPLIPAALVVGQSVAGNRLRKKDIFCINLARIVVAGKVQIFCFDKTGTLTREGLEFYGFRQVVSKSIDSAGSKSDNNNENLEFKDLEESATSNKISKSARIGLGSCHSVTSVNGTLVGNPVDIEMFTASKYKVEPPTSDLFLDTLVCPSTESTMVNNNIVEDGKYNIVARHEFVHAKSMMSVIVHDPVTNRVTGYLKGSFERIKSVCKPDTIPHDYDKVSEAYAREGCYVLALATRDFGVSTEVDISRVKSMERSKVECDATFSGLILFKNKLRDDTKEHIRHLREGDCRTVMITGDNVLTGVHIARACDMISDKATVFLGDIDVNITNVNGNSNDVIWTNFDDGTHVVKNMEAYLATANATGKEIELAVSGRLYEKLYQSGELKKYLNDIRIYGRMTPNGKVTCVQSWMEHGITAMCGDGGNDCGALRAAHVGVAMSEAEASIVAPFSTKTRSIGACVEVLKEGRNALATSFASYKFLILYGTTMVILEMIQFYFSVIAAQYVWIIIDSLITILLSWTVTLAKPAERLSNSRPTAKLLGPQTVASICGQFGINIIFIVITFVLLFKQPFFKCNEFDSSSANAIYWWLMGDNYEAEVLGQVVLFQFINSAATVNFGDRFRASWYKNYILAFVYLFEMSFVTFLIMADPNPVGCFFRMNCGTPDVLVDLGYPKPYWDIAPYNNYIGHNVIPVYFRQVILGLGLTNAILNIFYERFVILGSIGKYLKNKFGKQKPKVKKL